MPVAFPPHNSRPPLTRTDENNKQTTSTYLPTFPESMRGTERYWCPTVLTIRQRFSYGKVRTIPYGTLTTTLHQFLPTHPHGCFPILKSPEQLASDPSQQRNAYRTHTEHTQKALNTQQHYALVVGIAKKPLVPGRQEGHHPRCFDRGIRRNCPSVQVR